MDWIQFTSQVGFPIAVSIFTLVRLDAAVRNNTQALTKLNTLVENNLK
jgi:hypothetical protein